MWRSGGGGKASNHLQLVLPEVFENCPAEHKVHAEYGVESTSSRVLPRARGVAG